MYSHVYNSNPRTFSIHYTAQTKELGNVLYDRPNGLVTFASALLTKQQRPHHAQSFSSPVT